MNDIHTLTGAVQEPLTTLADQLSDTSKEALQEVTEVVASRAPIAERLKRWWNANAGYALTGALVVGVAAGTFIGRRK